MFDYKINTSSDAGGKNGRISMYLFSCLIAFSMLLPLSCGDDDASNSSSGNGDDSPSCNLVVNKLNNSVVVAYKDRDKPYEVSVSFSSSIKELTKTLIGVTGGASGAAVSVSPPQTDDDGKTWTYTISGLEPGNDGYEVTYSSKIVSTSGDCKLGIKGRSKRPKSYKFKITVSACSGGSFTIPEEPEIKLNEGTLDPSDWSTVNITRELAVEKIVDGAQVAGFPLVDFSNLPTILENGYPVRGEIWNAEDNSLIPSGGKIPLEEDQKFGCHPARGYIVSFQINKGECPWGPAEWSANPGAQPFTGIHSGLFSIMNSADVRKSKGLATINGGASTQFISDSGLYARHLVTNFAPYSNTSTQGSYHVFTRTASRPLIGNPESIPSGEGPETIYVPLVLGCGESFRDGDVIAPIFQSLRGSNRERFIYSYGKNVVEVDFDKPFGVFVSIGMPRGTAEFPYGVSSELGAINTGLGRGSAAGPGRDKAVVFGAAGSDSFPADESGQFHSNAIYKKSIKFRGTPGDGYVRAQIRTVVGVDPSDASVTCTIHKSVSFDASPSSSDVFNAAVSSRYVRMNQRWGLDSNSVFSAAVFGDAAAMLTNTVITVQKDRQRAFSDAYRELIGINSIFTSMLSSMAIVADTEAQLLTNHNTDHFGTPGTIAPIVVQSQVYSQWSGLSDVDFIGGFDPSPLEDGNWRIKKFLKKGAHYYLRCSQTPALFITKGTDDRTFEPSKDPRKYAISFKFTAPGSDLTDGMPGTSSFSKNGLASAKVDYKGSMVLCNDGDPEKGKPYSYETPKESADRRGDFTESDLTKACRNGDLVEDAVITGDKVFVSQLDTQNDIHFFKIVVPE